MAYDRSEIERAFYRVHKSGLCYVLLFEPLSLDWGTIKGGVFSVTKNPEQLGRVLVRKGSRTLEYYFTRERLWCCVSYLGHEPNWLERTHLGEEPEQIRGIERISEDSDPDKWAEAQRQFEEVFSRATNPPPPLTDAQIHP